MSERPRGTGSVYYQADRDRWIGSYEAGWTTTGRRRRKYVSGRTKREAMTRLRDAMRAVDAESPARARVTVKAWSDQWLESRKDRLRPASWDADAAMVRQWIVPAIGRKRLDQLTPGDRRAVATALADAGRSQGTANRADSTLGKMLRDAAVEGHSVPNSVLLVTTSTAVESERDALPLPHALAVLEVALARPDASRWVAALLQAMRPAECLGLTWAMVDFEAGEIDVSWQLKALPYVTPRDRNSGFRVPRGYVTRQASGQLHLVRPKTKAGRRIIPMVPWMRQSLLEWREICPPSPVGLVWPQADGSPRSAVRDRREWQAICEAAGVKHTGDDGTSRAYHLYEARHTTATLLREAHVDEETITAIMGHSTMLSTRSYLHTDQRRTRAALEGLAGRLGLNPPAGSPDPAPGA